MAGWLHGCRYTVRLSHRFKCSPAFPCFGCRYLSTHIPSLDILPVKVTLVLADKGISIPDVIVQPNDV